jgi:predicted HTH domain antitoxin
MLTSDLNITIPTEITRALKIPEKEQSERLRLELAVHLYEEWLLSFGKAAELAKMSRWVFSEELGKRKVARHYTDKELDEDVAFANTSGDKNGR